MIKALTMEGIAHIVEDKKEKNEAALKLIEKLPKFASQLEPGKEGDYHLFRIDMKGDVY